MTAAAGAESDRTDRDRGLEAEGKGVSWLEELVRLSASENEEF